MKKHNLYLLLVSIAALIGAPAIALPTKNGSITSAYYEPNKAAAVAVFFDYAREKAPELVLEIARLEKQTPVDATRLKRLRAELRTFDIVNLIADRNIEALKKIDAASLKFDKEGEGQIWINDATQLQQILHYMGLRTIQERVVGSIIGGENALAFVLFHSMMNKTVEDNKKTVTMLKLLLDKKVDCDGVAAGFALFVKDAPSDTHPHCYSMQFNLPTFALVHSFPEALELLLQYGATFDQVTINKLIALLKDDVRPPVDGFERVLAQYKENGTLRKRTQGELLDQVIALIPQKSCSLNEGE